MARATISAANSEIEGFIVRQLVILLAAFLGVSTCGFAQWPPPASHMTLNIWPHGAPGAPTNLPPESDTTTAKDRLVAGKPVIRIGNVSAPTLTLYTPKSKSTGAAVRGFSRRQLSHPCD